MPHWKVTFYHNMSIWTFIGAFYDYYWPSTKDALMERVCKDCGLYFKSIKHKQNHNPNCRSKKSNKSGGKQSKQPMRKIRSQRIEARCQKELLSARHSKSPNSTPLMTLTLMVLRTIFQKLLTDLEPLQLTIKSLFGRMHKTCQMYIDFFFFFLLRQFIEIRDSYSTFICFYLNLKIWCSCLKTCVDFSWLSAYLWVFSNFRKEK